MSIQNKSLQFVTYPEVLAKLTADKWLVIQEGPSGAQLKRPRQMMTQTKVVLILGGVCLLLYWPLALLLIPVALLDYFVMTKERTFFLSRETPEMPPPK
jgi:hypothetical protein